MKLKDQRLNLLLDEDEMAWLRALSEAERAGLSETVRRLIVRAHEDLQGKQGRKKVVRKA